jgi:hypothetical protein
VSTYPAGPLLTLEPVIEAIRRGVEGAGWELSGLQKTTSHQFEGRWEGESTRSAYLFFHRPERWDAVGVDVYLDETSQGLQGNLSLVVDGPRLGVIGDVSRVLIRLGAAAAEQLPAGYRTPVSLRIRMEKPATDPHAADVEVRFKLRIPSAALEAGADTIADLAAETVGAFESLLSHADVQALLTGD